MNRAIANSRLVRHLLLGSCGLIAAVHASVAAAQIDSSIPYEDRSLAQPEAIAAPGPGWLRTGVGVSLYGDLKLDENIGRDTFEVVPVTLPERSRVDLEPRIR